MSNKQNDIYLEEVAEAEQDYKDDLKSLEQAREELRSAVDWQHKMERNCDASAKRLSDLKNKEF